MAQSIAPKLSSSRRFHNFILKKGRKEMSGRGANQLYEYELTHWTHPH